MIHDIIESQWLPIAKQLSIGGSTRIDHGHKSPKTLQINNNLSNWSCYCYACNAGKVVSKKTVRLTDKEEKEESAITPRNPTIPTEPYAIEAIDLFLRFKGLSLDIVESALGNKVMVSEDNRMIIMAGGSLHGRYLDNIGVPRGDKPKWLHYDRCATVTLNKGNSSVIVTEDLLSAIKALYVIERFGLEVDVICNLGTNISSFLLYQLRNYTNVMSAFDCDAAGYKATKELSRSVRLLYNVNLRAIDVLKYTGGRYNDLKYITIESIRACLEGYLIGVKRNGE